MDKLREIESKTIPHWYPPHKMMNVEDDSKPWGVKWRAGTSNFRTVAELYTKRNLWALAAVLENIKASPMCRDEILFTFSSILFKASRMMAHNSDGIGRIQKGTYYIPQISHDIHVWRFMEEALGDMILGFQAIGNVSSDLIISTSNACSIAIPFDSVDYIFTDPPYAENVQYGELNFVWEAWLELDTNWHEDEIVVNEVRRQTEAYWSNMMRIAMIECYKVLKPGRCISLCYHDTSEGTWALIQDIMAEAGFLIEKTESALFIDTRTKTTNQYFADKVNKRDLIINFRKPKSSEIMPQNEITGKEDEKTFNEKVRPIIQEYLEIHPGSTKDRVYDVVSRMVRIGKMEAHNFQELLMQVAEPSGVTDRNGGAARWYLKETEVMVIDKAESAKEDFAKEKIQKYISNYLGENPDKEGVHYSNLFEHYVYTVKDKPRRNLSEWLLDYFFKTESGTYRLPISKEEEKLKADGRSRGINRRIKRYIAYIEHSVPIPEHDRPNDATLMEWIRHCKRSGMFNEGKLLYEKGGLNLNNLSDENMVNVDEDYQVCVRMLARKIESKIAKDRKQTELTG